MANQLSIVSNNRRKRNQLAELEARQLLLPAMIANQQRQEEIKRQEELKNIQLSQFERQQALQEDQLDASERASRIGAGLEASKLGINIGNMYKNKTVGDLINKGKGLFGGTSSTTSVSPSGNFLTNLNIGSFVGGGLTGFGASRLVNKKKKGARIALGTGAGILSGLLSGGIGGAISGGIGGGIGSLF